MSKDTRVELVLWIDQNTFATALLEKVFKKKNLPFYTLSSLSDFSYLVDDMNPKLIVLDSKTAIRDLDQFMTQFKSSVSLSQIPFVLIDDSGDLPFIKNVIGKLNRPFDPFDVPQILEKFLAGQ